MSLSRYIGIMSSNSVVPLLTAGLVLSIVFTLVMLTKIHRSNIYGSNNKGSIHRYEGHTTLTHLRMVSTKHTKSSFTCPNSGADIKSHLFSKISQKEGKLNDNYCDCAGTNMWSTDEPGTPACSNLLKDKAFFCGWPQNLEEIKRNNPLDRKVMVDEYKYWPKEIFSSRVHDGVCDCCDGRDELDNPHLDAPCPNHCEASILEHERLEQMKHTTIHTHSQGIRTQATARKGRESSGSPRRR